MSGQRFHWAWMLVIAAAALAVGILFLLPTGEVVAPPPERPRPAVSAPAEPISDGFRPAVPAGPVSGPVTLTTAPGSSEWEDRLDNILSSEADNRTTVRQLLDGLGRLPVEAQEEYIIHALNLCDDEDYARVEAVYLAEGIPPEVSEEIFNDVLNRPDEIKLPLLARTLRNPAHPMAGEAREILEMYLDLDEGSAPPAGWEAAVRQYLAEAQED
jgi:hypothetical protein